MQEQDKEIVAGKSRVPAWLGPAVMLAGAVLTVAVVFLPWARLDVSDPNLHIRNGWYSGWELLLPLAIIVLMLVPIVFSVLMLSGRGTKKRNLETGFCAFALGMEFLLLSLLLVLELVLRDLSTKVDLFKIGLGIGFWIALVLLAVNMTGLVLTGYRTQLNATQPAAIPAVEGAP